MISQVTLGKLAELISIIAEGEKKLETCRIILAQQIGFEPYTAFRRIDRDNKSSVTSNDIKNFFLSNQIATSLNDILILIASMDPSNKGYIQYTEFQEAILPKNDVYLKTKSQGRSSYYVGKDEFLEYDIEMGLTRFFEQIIKNHKIYDLYRTELRTQYDFNISGAFNAIDTLKMGFLDLRSIEIFTANFGKQLFEDQIIAFIQYADPLNTRRLGFNQFMDIIQPGATANYSSPSKSQVLAQSFTQTVNERFSPKNSAFMKPTSPIKQSIIDPTLSPGGKKMNQTHFESEVQKQQDNYAYQEYLQNSRQRSIEKAQKSTMSPTQSRIINSQTFSPKGSRIIATNTFSPKGSRVIATQTFSPKGSRIIATQTGSYFSPTKQSQMIEEKQNIIQEIEEEHLMGMLKSLITLEREYQQLITDISLRQDFNLPDAFRLFDVQQNGNITKGEFEIGLNKLGLFPTYNEIYLFFEKFDKDKKGFLNYADFTNVFYTPNTHQVDLINSRKPIYIEPLEGENHYDVFSIETLRIYKNILTQQFKTEQTIDNFKLQLQSRPNFNLYSAFKSLDLSSDGNISYEDLKEMLYCFGIYTSENDMVSLFKRFDKNQDGAIQYSEFINEMIPKSPKKNF